MMQTKPKLFFTFLTILFLGGLFSISYYALTQRQEVRQKAATPEGAATLILSPSAQEFSVGKTESIKVTANAADSSIDGYQVVAKISGSIPPDLTFVPAENSGIQIVKSELTDSDTSGKLFTLAAVTKDPKQHIAQRGSLIPIGEFRFTPQTTGSFSVSFDQALTKVTKGKASDKNILNIPTDTTFTVVESTCEPRPICLDTPGSKCFPLEPPSGWCPPKPTPTPTPVNDCAGKPDGTTCVYGPICPVCPPGSTTCPKFPCYQQQGVCRNQHCGPLVLPTPTPTVSPTPADPIANCKNTGGTWQQFSNSCADQCFPVGLKPVCPQVLSMSCNCGTNACWDGARCIPNPPTPTPKPVSSSSLQMLSPNGGESLYVGQSSVPLTWNFTPPPGVNLAYPLKTSIYVISYIQGVRNFVYTIADQYANTSPGKNIYTWSIPRIEPGRYRIYLSIRSPGSNIGIFAEDESDGEFNLLRDQYQLTPTPTPSPKPVNTAPQIRNRSLPEGWVRTQYSAEVIATDPDPGDIVTITASGLPDRLRLTCNAGRRSILPNTQTMCRIEGEPTKRGTFDVRILARDSRGASTRRTFSLTILRRKAPLPALQPLFDRLPF